MTAVAPKIWMEVSFETGRQALKEWRESGARRSEEAVEIWDHVLSRSPSLLGDELWSVYEQICIAALDCARLDLAADCIDLLDEKFRRSNRVSKLKAMYYEADEKYEKATAIYDALVQDDPTNNAFRKRKVAILLSQNKRFDAIKELNEYLQIFLNDSEAWLQLSELYLAENELAKAAHCLEECVLASPLNTLYLRRLAEIRYTQGGMDNIELAKSYYDQAIKLNPSDLRAQYGVVLCSNYISHNSKGSADRKKEAVAAGSEACDTIVKRYENVEQTGDNPEVNILIDAVKQMKSGIITGK